MAAEKLFKVFNGPAPTSGSQVAQPTGTGIRTLLQVALSASSGAYIVEWGINFSGFTAAAPIVVELFGTTVAATMSAATVAADINKYSAPALDNSVAISLGTTALTGYATAAVTEGTPANVRMIDAQQISPAGQYVYQFPLGREPGIQASQFLRIRTNAAATVNAICYVLLGE